MPNGLDHIVHAVRDLDAAAAFYASAGFIVGARNRHPWGTHNRIVQLKNCYIELLAVAEPERSCRTARAHFRSAHGWCSARCDLRSRTSRTPRPCIGKTALPRNAMVDAWSCRPNWPMAQP
jgi:catechol 2,3-dioxygenase-like lactoylglutathione lyase family enzyme